jgi:hypothetical protein
MTIQSRCFLSKSSMLNIYLLPSICFSPVSLTYKRGPIGSRKNVTAKSRAPPTEKCMLISECRNEVRASENSVTGKEASASQIERVDVRLEMWTLWEVVLFSRPGLPRRPRQWSSAPVTHNGVLRFLYICLLELIQQDACQSSEKWLQLHSLMMWRR